MSTETKLIIELLANVSLIAAITGGILTLYAATKVLLRQAKSTLGQDAQSLQAAAPGELAKALAELVKAISAAPTWIALFAAGYFLLGTLTAKP